MNKKVKKLSLNREVLRTVDPSDLTKVAGGLASSSDACSQLCTTGASAGNRTLCICPFCESNPCA
ncbi:MAG TPA: hypothetical protein VL025_08660 [Thermoanaerobaculia bacterium]|nr:hypothetical protein [Thermoanaerobaculia bacterium]